MTNPKYSEWEHGISQALPHLEEAADKLQPLQFETAERDIIEAIRIGVNTPFAQARLFSRIIPFYAARN
jgi:hypothetical protein